MQRLIIYFKEITASIDSAMTMQVLNDYGHLSNFNNKVIVPMYAKTNQELSPINKLLAEKNFLNLHILVLPKSHKIIRSLFLIAYLISLLIKKGFSSKVIIVREKKYLWFAKILKRIFHFCLLVEFHETSLPEKETQKLRLKHQKLLLNIAGALLTNSSQAHYFKKYKYHLPRNQIILPNGLDVTNYSKVKRASLRSRPRVLTYTGQFTNWKNVPLLFEALHYLPTYFHLRIAGGKENSPSSHLYVNNLVAKYNLAGRVKYYGFVHPSALTQKVLNGSHVLLLPLDNSTMAQYATSPMKLVEYMATPIPIVAVNAPSVKGLSGKNSIFLAKPHAQDFAKVILNIFKMKSNEIQKRVKTQNQISKQYDFNSRASKYHAWLNDLI